MVGAEKLRHGIQGDVDMSNKVECQDCCYWTIIPVKGSIHSICTMWAVTPVDGSCEDGLPKPKSEPADIEDAYQRGFTVGWCGALNEAQKMLENQAKKVGDEQ